VSYVKINGSCLDVEHIVLGDCDFKLNFGTDIITIWFYYNLIVKILKEIFLKTNSWHSIRLNAYAEQYTVYIGSEIILYPRDQNA